MESKHMLTPRKKKLYRKTISQRRMEPTTLHQAGQPAQHTTNQLFRPPPNRTTSPTHYQPAISAPTKQDNQPNTLPTSYFGPHQTGQPAQHTTNQLFRPPPNRTTSPTHYQPAIPAPRTASLTHYQPAIPSIAALPMVNFPCRVVPLT